MERLHFKFIKTLASTYTSFTLPLLFASNPKGCSQAINTILAKTEKKTYRPGLPLAAARLLPAAQRVFRPCESPGNRPSVLPFQLICLLRLLSHFLSTLFQLLSSTPCSKVQVLNIFLVHFPYIVQLLRNKAYCFNK